MASGIEVRCTYPGLSMEFNVHKTADDWEVSDDGSLCILLNGDGVATYPSGHWTRVQFLDPFDGDSDTADLQPGDVIIRATGLTYRVDDDGSINRFEEDPSGRGETEPEPDHQCKPPSFKETIAHFHVCSCGQVYEPRVTLDAEMVWVRVDRSITAGGDNLNPEWLKKELRAAKARADHWANRYDHLARQIDQLAQFIMNKFPRWVGDGGAVNAAINILSKYTKDKKTNIINNPDSPVKPVCTNPEHSGMDKHRVGRYIGCYVAPVPESNDRNWSKVCVKPSHSSLPTHERGTINGC